MAVGGDAAAAPESWWGSVRAALTDLGRSCDLGRVRALAVDGTSGTVLAVDQTGAPVGRARMYDEPCDDEAVLRAIADHAPAGSAARGATSALARVLMMQDRPGVRHILHQADWIAGRLSGRFDRSDWNNALKTGYDPVAARWPDWIARAGADVGKLPVVLEPGAPIGRVSAEAVSLGVPASALGSCGNDGWLRVVSRDRRGGDGRRGDRARIDAGRQALVRPADFRSGVRRLQPSDRFGLACGRRLEHRRQGDRAVLPARSSCSAFGGAQIRTRRRD